MLRTSVPTVPNKARFKIGQTKMKKNKIAEFVWAEIFEVIECVWYIWIRFLNLFFLKGRSDVVLDCWRWLVLHCPRFPPSLRHVVYERSVTALFEVQRQEEQDILRRPTDFPDVKPRYSGNVQNTSPPSRFRSSTCLSLIMPTNAASCCRHHTFYPAAIWFWFRIHYYTKMLYPSQHFWSA